VGGPVRIFEKRCPHCRRRTRLVPTGKFRLNANRRLLDAWLLMRCLRCETTCNLAVVERKAVAAVGAQLLARLQQNDPELIDALLSDGSFLRRHGLVVREQQFREGDEDHHELTHQERRVR
jgi:hypothetical protein